MLTSDWRKSSRSGNSGGNCVEVRLNGGSVQVRDSKLGDGSPVFDLSPEAYKSLLRVAQR